MSREVNNPRRPLEEIDIEDAVKEKRSVAVPCSRCRTAGILPNNDTCMDCGGTGIAFELVSTETPIQGLSNNSPVMASLFSLMIQDVLMRGGCVTDRNAVDFHQAIMSMLMEFHGPIELYVEPTDEPHVIKLSFHATRREGE